MTHVEQEARAWLGGHEARARPLEREANLAGWNAATTGSAEDLRRSTEARTAVRHLYSDRDAAARVRALLAEPELRDPLLRRQLVLLDLTFTGHQLEPETIEELTRREAELEEIFYNFRATLDGEELSNNSLLEVLRTERDSTRRRGAWEAGKLVCREIAPRLLELVRRRNEAARGLGYRDFYAMQLALQEIDEERLFSLLEEFRSETDEAFGRLRAGIDRTLAERYAVPPGGLFPWHWEDMFSQEAPSVGEVDLDGYFRGRDLVRVASDYFSDIGLPVDDVLGRSDLFEREGKDQHAFCTDIDREGDVRILCNLRDNERWMGTLLHELGHAAYDKFLPRELPYLLRAPAHTLTTEAVAMYMGRLPRTPAWLRERLGAEVEPRVRRDIDAQLRTSMLVAGRWILVMAHFERALYRDPDRADLNGLWWELVERFQWVRRPEGRDEPDWAAKIHLSLAPVYYHNYLLGELMASQLGSAMASTPGNGGAAGAFLRDRIFARGAVLPWNELLVESTGEPLSARHFIRDFVPAPTP